MTEREKVSTETPPFEKDPEVIKIFDEAVNVLKAGNVYGIKLNQKQTGKLMSGFVDEVVKKQREDAWLRTINVEIEENKGK